jgi:hypothetical protein
MRRHPISSVMKMTAAIIAGVRQAPSQLRAAATAVLCVQSVEKRRGTSIATSGEGGDMLVL